MVFGHEEIRDVASWVVSHAEIPRFPGPLLRRTRALTKALASLCEPASNGWSMWGYSAWPSWENTKERDIPAAEARVLASPVLDGHSVDKRVT